MSHIAAFRRRIGFEFCVLLGEPIVCHAKATLAQWRAIRSDYVVAQDTVDVDTTAEDGIDARLTAIETKIDVKLEPIRRDLAVIKHAVKAILLRLR